MFEKVEFTNMCMISSGNRVVVIDRKKQDWPGLAFPGGHVEPGESFTDAVIREVREETGLTIRSPRLCGIKNWYGDGYRYVVLFYRVNCFEGELRSSEEGEVRWEALSDLPGLPLAPDMNDMLRVFMEDDLSEFYYYQDGDSWQHVLK